jgi:hypothetical protein
MYGHGGYFLPFFDLDSSLAADFGAAAFRFGFSVLTEAFFAEDAVSALLAIAGFFLGAETFFSGAATGSAGVSTAAFFTGGAGALGLASAGTILYSGVLTHAALWGS